MEHTQYDKIKLTSWIQQLINEQRLLMVSNCINILGYWGLEYAETTFQRYKSQIPGEYLVLNPEQRLTATI
jgi:hypothetical protein